MPDFLVYHNPDSMGYSAREIDTLSLLTDKKVGDVIGSRVWLVTGEGSPRDFFLYGYFIIETVESGEDQGFQTRLTGSDGQIFNPMLPLASEDWFDDFKKSQGNFAFGFQPINDDRFIRGLELVAKNCNTTTEKFFPFSIYTIRHTDELEAVYSRGGAGEFVENTPWVTGKELFEEARKSEQNMPLLLSAADASTGLIYFAFLERIEINREDSTTRVEYSNLQPLIEEPPKSSLILMNTNTPLLDSYIRPYAICYTPDYIKQPRLNLYGDYSRQDVHDIFAPDSPFTPQRGTWGILGIVSIPKRPNDFVFFVTLGQQQGGHTFDEGVTEDGVLTWQSQPRQSLNDSQIQQFINHDELQNSIHLFLRTRKGRKYTYLGRLKYLSHDNQREKPVYFQWQILDWNIPTETLERLALTLEAPEPELAIEERKIESQLEITPPPPLQLQKGSATRKFRAHKVTDYSKRDAENKVLGLLGEKLVVKNEKDYLINAGRSDLAARVRHVSIIEGDGAGYDIESFTTEGQVKYIEVKTTCSRAETPFFMSSNEIEFSKQHSENYYLYRVYGYDKNTSSGKVYIISGNVEGEFYLKPIQFRASRE